MKKLKHLFTMLLLLCATIATAHNFEVNGIYYNIINTANKTVEVTYRGAYYWEYSNEYTGSVVIPESVAYSGVTYRVTSIGGCAFELCSGLTSIEIPNSVISIGDFAFSGCTGLTSIKIPNSVTSIGYSAFYGCSGLASVEIPNSVTSIGVAAFYGCTGLTGIEIPNSVTSIGDWAFGFCTGLTCVVIPNSVTSIGESAFCGCQNVESLYISSTIKRIGANAFAGCDKITEIKSGSEKPIWCDANIFASAVYDNATLYVPNGAQYLYENTAPWNNFNIVEMDFTGIDEIAEQRAEGKNVYYDLSGRAVENPTKGVYIINGKKVMVK